MGTRTSRFLAGITAAVIGASLLLAAPASAADTRPQPIKGCDLIYDTRKDVGEVVVSAICAYIPDMSPLKNFPHLEMLWVNYNFQDVWLDSSKPPMDLALLGSLPNLVELELGGVTDANIGQIPLLPKLTVLDINGSFSDVSVVAKQPAVTNLGLSSLSIKDVSLLATMPNLTSMKMFTHDLYDLSPLAASPKLNTLNVTNTGGFGGSPIPKEDHIRTGNKFNVPTFTGPDGKVLTSKIRTGEEGAVKRISNTEYLALTAESNGYWGTTMEWTTNTAPPGGKITSFSFQASRYYSRLPELNSLGWDKTFGPDRYSTSAAISKVAYPGTASVVYLASGANFPDALVAGPAAATEGGPLLLTNPTILPSSVKAEIQRLKPKKVVVVGGAASVSAGVLNAVKNMVPNTVRRGGADRYAVARAVAAATPWKSKTAYIASGLVFPDALSAAAPAGAQGAPVLLVPGTATRVDTSTKSALLSLGINKTIIAGGTATVSEGIEQSLAEFNPERVGGVDRYAVNRALNAGLVKDSSIAYYASGLNFTDALAGSAVAGIQKAPLYLARTSCISSGILSDISASKTVTRAQGFGGFGESYPMWNYPKINTCG